MPEDADRWKQLAMQWKRAAPHLAAARRESIRRQNNSDSIASLNSAYLQAIRNKKPSRTSGFVEMYRVLLRSRI